MMMSFEDHMEQMDAQTKKKRKNRLLLYDESLRDEMVESQLVKTRAMMDLRPVAPWTDRFLTGSFHKIPHESGRSKQLAAMNQQLGDLNEFETYMLMNEPLGNVKYPGLGNEKKDFDTALKMTEDRSDFRRAEIDLIESIPFYKLNSAVRTLRPTKKDDQNYLTNNQIIHMNIAQKVAYLVETLGKSETEILDAM